MSENLFDVLRRGFPGDDTAFLLEPGRPPLTYGDLVARSAQYASCLARLGVKPGDRVAVQTEKSPQSLFLYLGVLRAGGVYLPLNPAYTIRELDYYLQDAGPHLVVCRPEMKRDVEAIAAGAGVAAVETLDANGGGSLSEKAAMQSADFADIARARDDLAAILYTSGTTGRSKGAMLTHGNLASNAEALREAWRYTAGDRLIHALPIFHTHGLFVAVNLTLRVGASMIFLRAFDAEKIIELMPKATVLMGVPTYYSRLLARPELTRSATRGMRVFISGSAPLPPKVHHDFEARTGHAILERYGMTETSMNTSNPYDGRRVPGSVGFPLPGVEVRIVDAQTGATVSAGEVGEIEIRGPNVFKGYWQMPEKTREELHDDGFFRSGDLGYRDAEGYIHISGRSKDLIISGGLNVYPAEIEAAIEAIPGVEESAVIGVPHADFGEGVVAVVTRRSGSEVDESAIQAALTDRLAKFKQPKRIFIVGSLPRNVMGKIEKKSLRETFAGAFN